MQVFCLSSRGRLLSQSALMKWIGLKHHKLELIQSDERQEHIVELGLQVLLFTGLKDKRVHLHQGLDGLESKPWSFFQHTGSRPWQSWLKALTTVIHCCTLSHTGSRPWSVKIKALTIQLLSLPYLCVILNCCFRSKSFGFYTCLNHG